MPSAMGRHRGLRRAVGNGRSWKRRDFPSIMPAGAAPEIYNSSSLTYSTYDSAPRPGGDTCISTTSQSVYALKAKKAFFTLVA